MYHSPYGRQKKLPIFFAFILCQGFLIICICICIALFCIPSYFWQKTTGIITNSSMDTTRTGASEWRYKNRIEYSYTVSGKKYSGNRRAVISFLTNSSKKAESIKKRYSNHSSVIVYYYHKKPEKSVLEPGISKDILPGFLVGVVLISIGTIGLYFCKFTVK